MEKNKKPEQIKSVKSVFKGAVRNTTIIVMSTALVTYPLDLKYINAYFTDRIVYSKDGRISGKRTVTTMSNGVVELYFDIHTFNDLKVDFNVQFVDDILIAEMSLPDDCGFNAEDIMIDSLELTYDNEIIGISPIEVQTSGRHLQLKYDWRKIAAFIDIDDYTPAFDISGKGRGMGKSGLGEKFIFRGSGRTPDLQREFFEQMKDSFYVDGLLNITVPMAEEGQQVYSYTFYLDGKEVPADEIEWELLSQISGVRLEAGKLIVESGAGDGPIIIRATLKSNRYFKYELQVELVKVEEEIQEIIEEIPENPEEVPEDNIEGEQPEEPGLDPVDQDKEDVNLPSDPADDKLSDDKDDEDNSEGDNNDEETDTENEGENEVSDDEADKDKDEDEPDPENEEAGDEDNNTDNEDNGKDQNDNSSGDNPNDIDEPEEDNTGEDEETVEVGEEDESSDRYENGEGKKDEANTGPSETTEDEETAENENLDNGNPDGNIGENQEENSTDEEPVKNPSENGHESYESNFEKGDKSSVESNNDKNADSVNKGVEEEVYTDE